MMVPTAPHADSLVCGPSRQYLFLDDKLMNQETAFAYIRGCTNMQSTVSHGISAGPVSEIVLASQECGWLRRPFFWLYARARWESKTWKHEIPLHFPPNIPRAGQLRTAYIHSLLGISVRYINRPWKTRWRGLHVTRGETLVTYRCYEAYGA